MKEELINSAAQGYCDAAYGTLKTNQVAYDAFKEGMKFGINEDRKSLWHSTKEEPKPQEDGTHVYVECIIEDDWGFGVRCWNTVERYWDGEDADDFYCEMNNIRRWCYVRDILPNK